MADSRVVRQSEKGVTMAVRYRVRCGDGFSKYFRGDTAALRAEHYRMKANEEPCKLGPHVVEESSDDGRTWAESVPWPPLSVLRVYNGEVAS